MNIRVGDIVEVELAFIAIPVKEDKYRMLISLRGITLLKSGHRTVSPTIHTPSHLLMLDLRTGCCASSYGYQNTVCSRAIPKKATYVLSRRRSRGYR